MAEKYNFNWRSYAVQIQDMFKDLYHQGTYSDVTLISDDQIEFKAHRIVLSACSSVFKKIIDNNPSQHPLIYLRGIESYEIESILQFMYLGEGRLSYNRMGEFIKVVKDLKVKEISNKFVKMEKEEKDGVDEDVGSNCNEIHPDDTSSERQDGKESFSDGGDESTETVDYIREEESKQEAKTYLCHLCDYRVRTKKSLKIHIQSVHEGVRYTCNDCDFYATTKRILRIHIQSIHEGMNYSCDKCNFESTYERHLLRHIQAKHDGIKYPCQLCQYKASRKESLRKHIKIKHSNQ